MVDFPKRGPMLFDPTGNENRPVRMTSDDVRKGGYTEAGCDEQGHFRVRWILDRVVKGIAYDTPLVGYTPIE